MNPCFLIRKEKKKRNKKKKKGLDLLGLFQTRDPKKVNANPKRHAF